MPSPFDTILKDTKFVPESLAGEWLELYQSVIQTSLEEYPKSSGYSTLFYLLVERAAFYFVAQKQIECKKQGQVLKTSDYPQLQRSFSHVVEELFKEKRQLMGSKHEPPAPHDTQPSQGEASLPATKVDVSTVQSDKRADIYRVLSRTEPKVLTGAGATT